MKELISHRLLLPAVERHADKVGFIDGRYRGPYAGHIDRVARLCVVLQELGVGRHERFAVMVLNSHPFLEGYHAAFLGAGINPLNWRLASKELEFILQDSGTRVCFVDAMFAPVIAQLRAAAGIEQVVLIGDGGVPHDHKYQHLLEAVTPALSGALALSCSRSSKDGGPDNPSNEGGASTYDTHSRSVGCKAADAAPGPGR
jgi:acyl-CoA synthetase (AMP-forming)/AMP-acid ligase II